jgi:D-aminopeptidase
VAVNPVGSVTIGDTPHFWAAPFERHGEYGGLGMPHPFPAEALQPRFKRGPAGQSTTIAVIATDAALDRTLLKRLAIMANAGMARAVYPAHTSLDGDIVFALATGAREGPLGPAAFTRLGTEAANTLTRAIARGVYEARSFEAGGGVPAYRDLFGKA